MNKFIARYIVGARRLFHAAVRGECNTLVKPAIEASLKSVFIVFTVLFIIVRCSARRFGDLKVATKVVNR